MPPPPDVSPVGVYVLRLGQERSPLFGPVTKKLVMQGMCEAAPRVLLDHHDLRQGEGALAVLVGEPRLRLGCQPFPPPAIGAQGPAPSRAHRFAVQVTDYQV